jgi:hypothetical protein
MHETGFIFQIKMPPDRYEKLVRWAKDDKVFVNALVLETLQAALKDHESDDKASKQLLVQSK